MSSPSTGEDRNIYSFGNSDYRILWTIQGRKGHSFYNQRARKGSEANMQIMGRNAIVRERNAGV